MSYRINEVARKTGLPVTTIRYYDREGLLPNVKRSEGGQREFSDADVHLLQVIECLKNTGMSLKDIRRFSALVQQGDASLAERRQMFYERREAVSAQMQELRAVAELIERKCAYYEAAVAAGAEDAVDWNTIEVPAGAVEALLEESLR